MHIDGSQKVATQDFKPPLFVLKPLAYRVHTLATIRQQVLYNSTFALKMRAEVDNEDRGGQYYLPPQNAWDYA